MNALRTSQEARDTSIKQPGAGETNIVREAPSDYALVREAIDFLTSHRVEQPGLDVLAAHLGLAPSSCQKLFKRWCGLSPKAFLQALTMDHARSMLDGSASVLETSLEVGLSGGGRLHDLFVDFEGMTPGDYKRRGAGLEISYGFHMSPFGVALVMATGRGVCGLAFADDEVGGRHGTEADAGRAAVLGDMMARWPAAHYREAPSVTLPHVARIFGWPDGHGASASPRPLRLVLIGTDFEVRVWETLLRIPMGRAVTYSDIASHLGRAGAARAVGSAVGRNPVSFVVPCHRVLRKDGALGGYHWGVTRKQALIGWERGLLAQGGVSGHAPRAPEPAGGSLQGSDRTDSTGARPGIRKSPH